MSDFLLNAGRQTLLLELQEASRLPERLGEDFVRAANTIIHCEGKVIVAGIGKSGHIGKKIAALRCAFLTDLNTLQNLSFVNITTKLSVLTQIMFNTLFRPLKYAFELT